MEGPAVKRQKLLSSVLNEEEDWSKWYKNLEILQSKLMTNCLCFMDIIELKRPFKLNNDGSDLYFPKDYILQFISTINLLSDLALRQQASGFICTKVLDMISSVSKDEIIWELFLHYLNSTDKFISMSSSKCFMSLLMWTKLPNSEEVFNELLMGILPSSSPPQPQTVVNPLKICHTLDLLKRIIEYKDECEQPIEESLTTTETNNPMGNTKNQNCSKLEVEPDFDSEVKDSCIKSLSDWWTRLVRKFKELLSHSNYEQSNSVICLVSFFSLWQSLISVKTNLNVVDTKHFYLEVESFVQYLNSSLPPLLWKKLIDVFNEILCYGSTLSLQDLMADEPCNLSHQIIRGIKSQQFLQGIPFSKEFTGFGGNSYGPVDWQWESESLPFAHISKYSTTTNIDSFVEDTATAKMAHLSFTASPSTCQSSIDLNNKSDSIPCSSKSLVLPNTLPGGTNCKLPAITTQIYIGPSSGPVLELDESFDDRQGDRTLLMKVVLLVLKCVAVIVKETKYDNDSSASEDNSASESDTNDMIIIERSIRDVYQKLDSYVKSLLPFHPEAPLAEWIVKLFADQDDILIEGMLCALDTFTGFYRRIDTTPDFYRTLNPVLTFQAFATLVTNDKDTLLDLLMSNETCFLLYILRYLKYVWKNWHNFVASSGRELESTMGLLIRLKMSIERLVEKALFPYNINPVLRLLERLDELYESKGQNNT